MQLHELPCRLLSANPLVAFADGFLSKNDCQKFIAAASGHMNRAQIGSDDAVLEVSADRTNSDCWLAPSKSTEAFELMTRLAGLVVLPVSHGEGVSVLHYATAEEFKPHADGIWSGADADAIAAFEADGGQRLFTAMVYLNEVEAGGGTVFPELGLRVTPAPGRLLIFANTASGNRDADPRSIHAGEAVTAGEKWAAVTWWRERPFGTPP